MPRTLDEKMEEIVLIPVDICLLGCNAVWTYRQIPAFWRTILPPFSGLKKI
jgi:hypothetical protein